VEASVENFMIQDCSCLLHESSNQSVELTNARQEITEMKLESRKLKSERALGGVANLVFVSLYQ